MISKQRQEEIIDEILTDMEEGSERFFQWEQQISFKDESYRAFRSAETNLYKPQGLLKLPFHTEVTSTPHYRVWTSFHPAFSTGRGVLVLDEEINLFDGTFVDLSEYSTHWRDFKREKLTDSLIVTRKRTVDEAINTHVQKYFAMRKDVLDGKKKLPDIERMNLLGCFTEYK